MTPEPDMVRLRHREGAEIAWEQLCRWLRHKGAGPAALTEMAWSFRDAEPVPIHNLYESLQTMARQYIVS